MGEQGCSEDWVPCWHRVWGSCIDCPVIVIVPLPRPRDNSLKSCLKPVVLQMCDYYTNKNNSLADCNLFRVAQPPLATLCHNRYRYIHFPMFREHRAKMLTTVMTMTLRSLSHITTTFFTTSCSIIICTTDTELPSPSGRNGKQHQAPMLCCKQNSTTTFCPSSRQ